MQSTLFILLGFFFNGTCQIFFQTVFLRRDWRWSNIKPDVVKHEFVILMVPITNTHTHTHTHAQRENTVFAFEHETTIIIEEAEKYGFHCSLWRLYEERGGVAFTSILCTAFVQKNFHTAFYWCMAEIIWS